jgi:alpha-glucosidase
MELKWGTGRARVTVIEPDVFRVRVCQKKFGPDKSWAIERKLPERAETRSTEGAFVLSEPDRSWILRDARHHEILKGSSIDFADARGIVKIDLGPRDRIFGLGETTGPMDKRGLRRELWNIDVLGHAPGIHPGLRSLYVSIPFAIFLRDGRAVGVFWDNPARQIWDMGHAAPNECRIECDHGEINLYFFLGPTVQQILERFTLLTGRMPMPPRWALGYHQCRYSYESAERVLEIATNFRARQIPCDAIYLDIDHMDGYRVFTFGKTFPNPKELTTTLAKNGFRTVAIVDPGVKNERKFPVLRRGVALDAFVKSASGKRDYLGKVWPGAARFPDFLSARVRKWWAREQQALHRAGIAGIWNDMNEPADFALLSKTLPPDCQHRTDLGPAPHVQVHNVYGMQMARASREGAMEFNPGNRPFVISRAGYAGVQKSALIWTGDNSSTWEHLAESIPMLLNLSLSGVAFCGCDVGGFLENCTGELLARWTQAAALTPFFRNHSNTGTRSQEPWAFGEEVENVCRGAIQLRYQFMPYLYALFAQAARSGSPVMRPLFWHFQNDPQCTAAQDEFLLGESLLVAPVILPGARARSVYLPPGEWHEFWSAETHRGRKHILAEAPLHLLPLYVKAGAIIPFAPLAQNTSEYSSREITLQIWPGADGRFEFFDDDGESQKGPSYRRCIEFFDRDRGGVIRFGKVEGSYRSGPKVWRILLHRAHTRGEASLDGDPLPMFRDRAMRFLAFETPERREAFEITVA